MSQSFEKEQVLIDALLAGKDDAFRYAVKHYNGIMRHVAVSIVGDAISDEVVQESWISVIKALPNFEGRASLKTWMLRIVSNCAKTRLRKETRSVAMGDALDLEQTLSAGQERFDDSGHWSRPPHIWHGDTPDSLLSSNELMAEIHQAIDILPPTQKSVLTLREMENLDMEEICKILDISESNGRVLLHRARTKVWQAIDDFEKK